MLALCGLQFLQDLMYFLHYLNCGIAQCVADKRQISCFFGVCFVNDKIGLGI